MGGDVVRVKMLTLLLHVWRPKVDGVRQSYTMAHDVKVTHL